MASYFLFIKNNLGHVAPLLGAGAIAIVIVIERTRTLIFDYSFKQLDAFLDRITYLVMSGKINEAIGLCERLQTKPAVKVICEGLLRAHQPESVIEHGLEIAVNEVNLKLQARTGFLATVANVATLLGLFGTILGLVQSFEAVGSANAQERATLLAAGISTAMNATMMGLAIAIPCMVAYSILVSRTNRLTAEIEGAALKILDILKQRYYGTAQNVLKAAGERSR